MIPPPTSHVGRHHKVAYTTISPTSLSPRWFFFQKSFRLQCRLWQRHVGDFRMLRVSRCWQNSSRRNSSRMKSTNSIFWYWIEQSQNRIDTLSDQLIISWQFVRCSKSSQHNPHNLGSLFCYQGWTRWELSFKNNNDISGSWHTYRQMEQMPNFTMTYGELIEECLVENNYIMLYFIVSILSQNSTFKIVECA